MFFLAAMVFKEKDPVTTAGPLNSSHIGKFLNIFYLYWFEFEIWNAYYIHSVKYRTASKALFLYFNFGLSVMLDSLSCPFTSISFLTTSCFFTLISI